jgi:hypothetical protein
MEASVVDLRYKMKEVLKALSQNETVKILYHGKITGTIIPAQSMTQSKKVEEHPLFGIHKKQKQSVLKRMEQLRASRYKE